MAVKCSFDVAPVSGHGGDGGKSGDASVGGSSVGTGGSWVSSGGTSADDASDGTGGSPPGPVCGNGACEGGESCSGCPSDCPPGGTKDCYDNGLHSNCCSGTNTNSVDCLACNDDVGCPQDEFTAYCDRFSSGDNLWQQYHRNWVQAQCGGPAQSNATVWYCTNASTCTTYTCSL